MINPLVPGVDPRQLAKLQEVTKNIKAIIRTDYKANALTLSLSAERQEAAPIIPALLEQMANGLASQLYSFFGISGEQVEAGKS